MPADPASSLTARPRTESYGELGTDGFRLTRWECEEAPPGERHAFEAGTLVLGLNVSGQGHLIGRNGPVRELAPGSIFISDGGRQSHAVERVEAGRHRFVALEMKRLWVVRWVARGAGELCDVARDFVATGRRGEPRFEMRTMGAPLAQIADDVLRPPTAGVAWDCWHHAKALEIVAHGLVAPVPTERFCERAKRIGRERVERVKDILRSDVEHPPGLAELGRQVGCSPFYLSRTFRQETGETISAFLRRARLERAADLLRAGDANVTEAALTVGYASLSHFSKAFSEAFGCCPCLYGRKPAAGDRPR